MRATYFIAQHIPDPFRQEPRNVGVFVQNGAGTLAKFVGERLPGELDGRTIRAFEYPEVYRQWVSYWRRIMSASNGAAMTAIVQAGGTNFRVIRGGELSDQGDDSTTDVLEYLYSMLVSEGRFAEAIAPADAHAAALQAELEGTRPLTKELESLFSDMQILADEREPELLVAHPIIRRSTVAGASVEHTPQFLQKADRLYVMETVDFRVFNQRGRAADHAGRTAYMFTDLKRRFGQHCAPIAIVRLPEEGYEDQRVQFGTRALRAESEEVVVWNAEEQRTAFLDGRRAIAMHRG